MKLPAILAALVAFCPLGAMAEPILFPQYGFQIDAFDVPVGDKPVRVLSTYLPDRNGFSPNVNVVIQPFANALDAFVNLSKKQIDQINGRILAEKKISAREWSVEYVGTMNKVEYHLYARALIKGGKAYVATATARAADWESDASLLRACVDSLTLN